VEVLTQPQSATGRDLSVRARERVLAGLRSQNDESGVLAGRVVREAAVVLGCSPRSLRRWLASGLPDQRVSRSLVDDELRQSYVRWHGNVAAVRRELTEGGRELPSLRTLQRAFLQETRPAERAATRSGEAGIRAHGLYVRWEAGHRNQVWQGDHKQLDVLVVPPRAKRPVRPWSTMFIDGYSRVITGWAISLRPSTAEVLAALRDGMLLAPADRRIGGIPEKLRIDHVLEFCAEAVRTAAVALDIEFSLASTYAPEEKGKIERLHRTCVQTFLSGLPLYTSGRRGANGRLQDSRAPLGLEQFVGLFADWVIAYNDRAHSELDGQPPIAVFMSDPTPLRTLAAEDARALLAARRHARVHRYGISHAGHRYIAADLHDLVGEQVEIAFAPHDHRTIEVYWRGAWISTATPQETLTETQQREVIDARRHYARELRRRQRAAMRAARGRLAPLTGSAPEPAEVQRGRLSELAVGRERSLSTAARTDLLIGRSGPPRAKKTP
jgi:putative transposase